MLIFQLLVTNIAMSGSNIPVEYSCLVSEVFRVRIRVARLVD